MTDRARELAHDVIREAGRVTCWSHGHTLTCELVTKHLTSALRAVRKEALEDAAKVAESNDAYGSCGGIKHEIASTIRKLIGESNE